MFNISLACPTCGRITKFADDDAGSVKECPHCREPLRIPGDPPPPPVLPISQSEARAAQMKEERAKMHAVVCRLCGSTRQPKVKSKITTAGILIVVFIAVPSFCTIVGFPLGLLALLVGMGYCRDTFYVCPDCGAALAERF